jgi:hypothetical protein
LLTVFRAKTALAFALLMVVAFASPVAAQTIVDRDAWPPGLEALDGDLTFRWVQSSTGGDHLYIWGMPVGSRLDESPDVEAFALDVAESMGAARDDVELDLIVGDIFDDSNIDKSHIDVDLGTRLLTKENSWTHSFDMATFGAAADDRFEESFAFEACPLPMPRSMSGMDDDPISTEGCDRWEMDTSSTFRSAPQLRIVQTPDGDAYGRTVGVLAAVVAIVTAVLGIAAALLRRFVLKTLSATTLVLASCAIVLTTIAMWIAIDTFAYNVESVNDLMLIRELSATQELLAILLPSLVVALPGLVFAIELVRVGPRADVDAAVAGATQGPVPSWFDSRPASSPTPAPNAPPPPTLTPPQSAPPPAPPSPRRDDTGPASPWGVPE